MLERAGFIIISNLEDRNLAGNQNQNVNLLDIQQLERRLSDFKGQDGP